MWLPRRFPLQTIAGPKRSDKTTSTENYARSARTSRWAPGRKESLERGRLRQPPAPGDRIGRKCAPDENSAIVPCNNALPPDSSLGLGTETRSANKWPALHFHCCAIRRAIALPQFLPLRFAGVFRIPNPPSVHQLYGPFVPIPQIAPALSTEGRRIPGRGRT